MSHRDTVVDGTSWEFMRPAWWALHSVTIGALAYFATKTMVKK